MSAGSVKAPLIIPLRPLSHNHHSNAIDSATQIEISTDTPRAQIYFTVDGSRPDPRSWKSRKPQPGPTYLYRNSFTLQSGLKTIKAMALLPDTGQESNIVAKTFDVAEASKVNSNGEGGGQPKPDDYLFVKELKREMKKMQVSVKDSLLLRRKPPANGKKLTISLGSEDENQNPPPVSYHFLSLYLISFTVVCRTRQNSVSCGGSLQPMSTSAGANLEFCSICGSKVPVGSTKCLVCESTITASPESTNRRICQICGSLNPERVKYCLTCEANLPQTPTTLVNISPFLRTSTPIPINNSKGSSFVNCRICSRQNGLSARFCDWCGIQDPGEEELIENMNCICPSCFWQSPKDSNFCHQCGFKLSALEEINGFGDQPTVTPARFLRKTASTQTMELSSYSPSSNSKPKEFSRTSLPIIAPVSPGKGLWRMQVEHLVAHIKAYANTDPEFQKAISEPRLGKLLSAEVMGNQPEEVSILLTFHQHDPSIHLPTRKGNGSIGGEVEVLVEVPPSAKSYYSSRPLSGDRNNTPLRNPSSASTPTQQNSQTFRRKIVALRSPSSTSKLSKKSFQVHANKPSEVDNALMRELRPGHKADMYTVERLLMNGANPSCVDHYGDPLVVRAVRNQHLEVIHVLVKDGNTPLHEAVLLGSRAVEFVKLLLKLGANPNKKNSLGLTPQELAIEANSLAAADILANRES
ncbi:unnamed protein product [Rodentolepis nana]|uniref:DZANK-type domain-containing protein n=1 Tax=Rodentolepis nana TaxID=102285 RepID=A0A158QH51_RODNA|nr:unnamed protein product [Rodentolepis nana]